MEKLTKDIEEIVAKKIDFLELRIINLSTQLRQELERSPEPQQPSDDKAILAELDRLSSRLANLERAVAELPRTAASTAGSPERSPDIAGRLGEMETVLAESWRRSIAKYEEDSRRFLDLLQSSLVVLADDVRKQVGSGRRGLATEDSLSATRDQLQAQLDSALVEQRKALGAIFDRMDQIVALLERAANDRLNPYSGLRKSWDIDPT